MRTFRVARAGGGRGLQVRETGSEATGPGKVKSLGNGRTRTENPHALFETGRERELIGKIHAEISSKANGRDTARTVLFDRDFYASHTPDAAADPLAHYEARGRGEGRSPHPLFDPGFYRRQLKRAEAARGDLVAHYLETGWREGLSPYPLFDPSFYSSQIKGADRELPPLLHYLVVGWREKLRPHRLFDPEHFDRHFPGQIGAICPLVRYVLQSDPTGEPHYLFSDRTYIATAVANFSGDPARQYKGGPPLVHYIAEGAGKRLQTHPLFNPKYYRQQIIRTLFEEIERLPETLDRVPDLLLHYLDSDHEFDISPTPFFFPTFYRSQFAETITGDPLRHYLTLAGFRTASPHPAIDLEYYASRAEGFNPNQVPVIAHILNVEQAQRVSPHPAFDPDFYRANNIDISDGGLCPIRHFLEYGMRERRKPNRVFSPAYVGQLFPRESLRERNAGETYLANGVNRRLRVLFVSHDATRTGAPAIVLRLMQDFAKLGNCECFAICDRGGERLGEFERAGHVLVMPRSLYELGEDHEDTRAEIRRLISFMDDNPPALAFVNSAESRHIGAALSELGIPVISLVHEIADFYPAAVMERIARFSTKVVFPARFVLECASRVVAMPAGKAIVRGQGLLRDDFGKLSRTAARRMVLKELDLPENVFLVIACGTVDQRKGVDYFVSAAMQFLGNKPLDQPACFIWIGDGSRNNVSPFFFALSEIKNARREKEIRFIGARADVEPYYVAGDAFILPARADPFPCVVHEAMAAGLPVVAFQGGGGAPELIGTDSGFSVPLGDTRAMASALLNLMSDRELREHIGQAGREKIAAGWRSSDYFGFMKSLAADTARVAPEAFGTPVVHDVNKRRVFFLSPDWSLSGVNTFTEDVIRQLNKRGYQAEVLFTRGRFTNLVTAGGKAILPNVPFRFLQPRETGFRDGWQRTSPNEVWRAVRDFIADQRPCALIPNYDYVAAALTPTLGPDVGVVGIAHSDHEEHYDNVYRLGRSWNRIVAVSDRISERVREDNASFGIRLKTIPYGVASPNLSRKKIAALKSKPGQPLSLIYAGRFTVEQKNILEYVRLARTLIRDRRSFRLTLCGEGPEFNRVKGLIEALSPDGVFEVLPRLKRDAVAARLARADVVLMLSDYEGLPLALLEGMAQGCIPIVYAMQSGIPQVIEDRRNGFIVARGDIDAASAHIQFLAENPDARLLMAEAAHRTIVDKRLREDDMGEAYARLLDEVFAELGAGAFDRTVRKPDQGEFAGITPPPTGIFGVSDPSDIWAAQLLT